MSKTVIIGGVAAGASCAARLRRLKETEEIILIERGENISYANCGLPYHIGEVITERDALLVTKNQVMKSRYNIDVRTNSEVICIHPEKKTITVKEKMGTTYEEPYDNLVLTTGSSPLQPNIPGIDSSKIKTLWTVPDTDVIKENLAARGVKHVVVVGGGFIGLETAENLHHLGLQVTLVEAADQVMAPLDKEMALILNKHIRSKGVNLILENGVSSFSETEEGIDIALANGDVVSADLVILAIGVRPNSELAKKAGIVVNPRGGIVVDDHMRTSVPSIYAAGDVVEVTDFIFGEKTMVPLAGPANKQGRIVADNIAGMDATYTGTQGSSIAKVFDLSVAATGASEKVLQRKGYVKDTDYKTILITQNHHAGYYPGALPLMLKLIFSQDGKKIYGAQIVGQAGVDKRIDTLATAIRFGASVSDLTHLELSYAPPFSSAKDPVNMAGYTAENLLNGHITFCDWDAVEKDTDAIVLDVRETPELQAFALNQAVHIPLGQLRSRLGELDKSKKYIVFCAIGVRAYNAARTLTQNGFQHVMVYPAGFRYYQWIH